jgi:membrane AbrB-like protein
MQQSTAYLTECRRLMTLPPLSLVLRWTYTLLIGALGGFLAQQIGAPLPWLLGGMIVTAATVIGGARYEGGPPTFPHATRIVFIPVIGVLIGGAFNAEVLAAMAGWWPGLIAVLAFVPMAHFANYTVFRRIGGLDHPTAYFSGMPGGLIESVELARDYDADISVVTIMQFARIAVVVTTVPLLFTLLEGRAVGSAAGQTIGSSAGMGFWDAVVLTVCGAAGYVGAKRLKVPAGQVMGPLFLSALAHVTGLTTASPPPTLVAIAQLVIGVTLGLRFRGIAASSLARFLGLSALSVMGMMLIGVAIASLVSLTGIAPTSIMFLSLSPGGLVEMGLIALSLNASPIFVTAHHLVRIVSTVTVGVLGWKRFGAPLVRQA